MTNIVLGAHWYALQVRSNYEVAVSTRLRELGVEEYLPIHRASPTAQRNKFNEGPPLFPGYIFCLLNLDAGPKLYSVTGVIRILGYGGHAMPIEDHEIAMVRSIADSPLPVEATSYLRAGNKICLTAGPLRGISGTFLTSAKGNKLVVSLPLLQRSLAVTVLSEWVAAVEPQDLKPAATSIPNPHGRRTHAAESTDKQEGNIAVGVENRDVVRRTYPEINRRDYQEPVPQSPADSQAS